jgi:hypothetical protein
MVDNTTSSWLSNRDELLLLRYSRLTAVQFSLFRSGDRRFPIEMPTVTPQILQFNQLGMSIGQPHIDRAGHPIFVLKLRGALDALRLPCRAMVQRPIWFGDTLNGWPV